MRPENDVAAHRCHILSPDGRITLEEPRQERIVDVYVHPAILLALCAVLLGGVWALGGDLAQSNTMMRCQDGRRCSAKASPAARRPEELQVPRQPWDRPVMLDAMW
jgi:hypothetical protein